MDENAKKKGLRMIPYGLQVLGAKHGDKQTVATINWTTQASFGPPLVVVGIKTDSTAHELVKQSKKFTLSMLGAGQKDLRRSARPNGGGAPAHPRLQAGHGEEADGFGRVEDERRDEAGYGVNMVAYDHIIREGVVT